MSQMDLASPVDGSSTRLEKLTKHLIDNGKICIERFPSLPRYVPLRSSDMFTSLVALYATQFRAQWRYLKSMVERITIPTGLHGSTYIARVLLSHWLIDVYVSNRKAVRELSLVGFSDHFMHKEVVQSQEYDAFLLCLHASLRPTNIKGGIGGHAKYIPLMAETVNWTNRANPFNIEGFTLDSSLFRGVIYAMKRSWRMAPIINNAVGGPCWLFDWHEGDKVCTWFPLEGNCTKDDIALAYVVGVACTPHLGARDADDWQKFSGSVPTHPNPSEFERCEEKTFYGGYEVRTIKTRHLNLKGAMDESKNWKLEMVVLGSSAGAETSTGECGMQHDSGMAFNVTIPQYQLTDWVYYARVIRCYDEECRSEAHRILSMT